MRCRLPQEGDAAAPLFIGVLIVEIGIVYAVDPARRAAPREARADRESILDDRHIDHRLRAPTEPVAALDRKAFGAGLPAQFARVGLDGNLFDAPAAPACAKESP